MRSGIFVVLACAAGCGALETIGAAPRTGTDPRVRDLTTHGFVASTSRMGGGVVNEMQIALDVTSTTPRLALGYFAIGGDSGTIVAWPASLNAEDGCANDRLVRGFVPRGLRFEPARWASLTLAP